jgi:hypothetical protein
MHDTLLGAGNGLTRANRLQTTGRPGAELDAVMLSPFLRRSGLALVVEILEAAGNKSWPQKRRLVT